MNTQDAGLSRTDWSMIGALTSDDEKVAADALEKVARRYWPAIYAFFRSSGLDVHQSSDLTQGFICDVIIKRELAHMADHRRGRFRSYLLRALKNHLAEYHRNGGARLVRASADRRAVFSLHDLPNADVGTGHTPDSAFSWQWAATLVRRVIERVRRECEADGLHAHWMVFELRILRPKLMGERPVEYDIIIRQLDIDDASRASNMIITVKRRFVRALVQEIERTVDDQAQVETELYELLRDLERPS